MNERSTNLWRVRAARGAARGGSMLMVVSVSIACGGCYERVVGAKGLGAGGTTVHKPYASDTMLDRAVMGPHQEPAGKRRIKSSQWDSTSR